VPVLRQRRRLRRAARVRPRRLVVIEGHRGTAGSFENESSALRAFVFIFSCQPSAAGPYILLGPPT
jgi:hypothetical protein